MKKIAIVTTFLSCLFYINLSYASTKGQAVIVAIEMSSLERNSRKIELDNLLFSFVKDSKPFIIMDAKFGTILLNAINLEKRPSRQAFQQYLERLTSKITNIHLEAKMKGINLKLITEASVDLISAYDEFSSWDIILTGSIYHTGDAINFTNNSYPNDGFILRLDTQFGYVQKLDLPSSKSISVHIFTANSVKLVNQYFRFYKYWFKNKIQAKLISFNDQFKFVTTPVDSISPLNTSVVKSLIKQIPKKPTCQTFDKHTTRELSWSEHQITLTNPCRANTIVEFKINSKIKTARANSKGVVQIIAELDSGLNNIFVKSANNNSYQKIAEITIKNYEDSVETKINDKGLLTLTGYNPQRPDGSIVSITDRSSGRTWSAIVDNKKWILKNIAIKPGGGVFLVKRYKSDGNIMIPIYTKGKCIHNRNVSTLNVGTVLIRFEDSCLAGKTLTLNYLGNNYTVRFDGSGNGKLKLSLTEQLNKITYKLRGTPRLIEIPLNNLSSIYKVTLIWHDRIDLDLHVKEPDGVNVYFANPKNIGHLDVDQKGIKLGTHIENYILKRNSLTSGNIFKIKVMNYTRKKGFSKQHCEGGNFATIPFKVIVIARGVRKIYDKKFMPVPCGEEGKGKNTLLNITNMEIK